MCRCVTILIVLVLALAAEACADEIYTFTFNDSNNSQYSFNFSLAFPTFITASQSLTFSPVTLANGLTLTQGTVDASPAAVCLGTSNIVLLADCNAIFNVPSEAIVFDFSSGLPAVDGTYTPSSYSVFGNNPGGFQETGTASLTIACSDPTPNGSCPISPTPEGPSVMLLGIGLAGLAGVIRRKRSR